MGVATRAIVLNDHDTSRTPRRRLIAKGSFAGTTLVIVNMRATAVIEGAIQRLRFWSKSSDGLNSPRAPD